MMHNKAVLEKADIAKEKLDKNNIYQLNGKKNMLGLDLLICV